MNCYKLPMVVSKLNRNDPVHLSIRIPPKYAVSQIMGYLKGKNTLMLFDRHPEWRRRVGRD
ncbi:MAG: transposase [Clostridia bacterium]